MIDAGTAREWFALDANTGVLFWRKRPSRGCVFAGDKAGSIDGQGYLRIKLLGRSHLAHRIVWVHHYGSPPQLEVDHINGDRSDNRIANLRDVDRAANNQNRRKSQSSNRSSTLIGATFEINMKKWKAQISVNKKRIHLGYFESAEQAHAAYVAAKRLLHPTCSI